MRVLFMSPHPDDSEIACGGTIARMSSEGHDCQLVVVCGEVVRGEGDLVMVHSGQTIPFTQRQVEQGAAAKLLGVSKVHYLNVGPASLLDMAPLRVGVGALNRLLDELKPDMIFAPLPSYNQDHQYTFDMTMAALRPGKTGGVTVYLYEQPTQYHGVQVASAIQSRAYSAYSEEHHHLKLSAIQAHSSQFSTRPDGVAGPAGVTALAKLRGLECDAEYAEMFHLFKGVVP